MRDKSELERNYVEGMITAIMRVGKRLLPILFVINAIALFYYLFKGYVQEFHSDSAMKNLIAEEVVQHGTYFPHDWNYVNGDLWVLFGQVFIIPLLPFFRNGYALHAIAGACSSVSVLSSLWFVSGMVTQSRWIRLLIVSIFTSGISAVMAENLFGQTSYGSVLATAAFSLYLSWRFLSAATWRSKAWWGLGFFVLGVLSFWGNPQRAAAYTAFPLLAAILAWLSTGERVYIWRPGARRWALSSQGQTALVLFLLLVLAAFGGALLHSATINQVNNVEGAGAAKWLSFEGFMGNAWKALEGLFGIVGGIPSAGAKVLSAGGLYLGLRAIATAVLLGLIPVTTAAFLRDPRPSARMVAAFTAAGLCLFLFLQITTTTPDMSDPITSARYMLPAVVFGIVLVTAYAGSRGLSTISGLLAWTVVVLLATSLISPSNSFSRIYRGVGPSVQQRLAAALQKEGLHYGYATYWNAGAVTVLSGGEVKVRQIQMSGSIPVPFRHLGSNMWYRPDAWEGETFLALTDDEAKNVNRDTLFAFTGQPSRVAKIDEFTVLVFASNISGKLPGWVKTKTADPDLDVGISELSRHNIGKLRVEKNRRSLRSVKGEVGFLHYGPYLDLPAGRYRVEFEIFTDAIADAGYVDVVTSQGKKVLAQSVIGPGQAGRILFNIDTAEKLSGVELRVFCNGSGNVELNRVAILRDNRDEPLLIRNGVGIPEAGTG